MNLHCLRAAVPLLVLAGGPMAAAETSDTNDMLRQFLLANPDADANHDGVLTEAEARAYARKHPDSVSAMNTSAANGKSPADDRSAGDATAAAAKPGNDAKYPPAAAGEPAWMPYVRDPAGFAWESVKKDVLPDGTIHCTLSLTSQVWQGATWKHSIQVWVPEKADSDLCVLFVDPNDPGRAARFCADAKVACAAVDGVYQACFGAPANEGMALYAFQQYMVTKDPLWAYTAPTTKTLVRSMDALEAWSAKDAHPFKRFVVTGFSKMGMATWMVGAVDPRVDGIVPVGADALNLHAQEAARAGQWGLVAGMIGSNRERFDTLLPLLDPWAYRTALTMPKLAVSGTNDGFYKLCSLGLGWNDLPGPKVNLWLANAGHTHEPDDVLTRKATVAFVHQVSAGKPMPQLAWKVDEGGRFVVTSTIPAKSAHLWAGASPTTFADGGAMAPTAGAPAGTSFTGAWDQGRNVFAALEYDLDGQTIILTSGMQLAADTTSAGAKTAGNAPPNGGAQSPR